MKTNEISINEHLEWMDLEKFSYALILLVLVLISILYGTRIIPERALLTDKKETVNEAGRVTFYSEYELLITTSTAAKLMENTEISELFQPKKLELQNTLKPDAITKVNTGVLPEVFEEVIPETPKMVMPVLSFEGNLRNDYCVGSSIDLTGLEILLDGVTIPLDDCMIEGIDTSVPGEYFVKLFYKDHMVEIPYTVIDYTVTLHRPDGTAINSLYNYKLDLALTETPFKLGKQFDGWYRDEACTIPFEYALPGEVSLDLYAGWKDFEGHVCDEEGYITAYTGSVSNGLLNLVSHPSCVGIRASAFVNTTEFVTDIYIPANITSIETGAFDPFPQLFFIYVHPDNPVFTSNAGILYTKDMSTIVAYPSGR